MARPCQLWAHTSSGKNGGHTRALGRCRGCSSCPQCPISTADPPRSHLCAAQGCTHRNSALSAAFVGKGGLKGKSLWEEIDRAITSLFYLCQHGCVQRSDSIRYPGEPITARSTAGARLGPSPLRFLNTVASSQKSAAALGKVQSGFPGQVQAEQSSGASVLTVGSKGGTPSKHQHNTAVRFLFQSHEHPSKKSKHEKKKIVVTPNRTHKLQPQN